MNNSHTRTTSPNRSSAVLRASLIIFTAYAAWEIVHKPVSGVIQDSMGEVYEMLFVKTVGLLLVLAMARGMGHWDALGFRGPLRLASLVYGLPLFLLAAAPLSSGAPITGLSMLLLWAAMIAIGVTLEEVLCRGLLWDALEAKGLWRTAVITSIAFGSIHLLGLTGSIPKSVILSQAVFAFGTGFTFAAVRIASGSVWAPTAAHFVFNYPALVAAGGITSTFQPGTEVRLVSAGVALMLVGVALVAVAKRRHEQSAAPGAPLDGSDDGGRLMRRIALALAAMVITSLARDEAVATVCESVPSSPPAAEGGFVDRAHDVESRRGKASEAPIAKSAVATIERLVRAGGHELNLRRLEVPDLDLEGTVDIYIPDVCSG